MPRSKDQAHKQPTEHHAEHTLCCLYLVTSPATPGQLAAWRRLWRLLLAEAVHHNGSPARRDEEEHHDQKC
jgi:hypothetical protein